MTRKSKRQLEKELEQLKGSGPSDIEVTSSVVTITEDMTNARGNLIEEPEAPGDYELGGGLETNSPVVSVHELEGEIS